MKQLIETIIRVSGKSPHVAYDTSKPDGSPRRNSDNTKAKEKMNFIAQTSLDVGLQKTIEWYKSILKEQMQ